MGICSSKQKYHGDIDKSQQLKAQPSQQQQEAINKKHQDEHKNNLNQVALNWKQNTYGIWKRPYDKLAIHTDIPRLGHKIEIIDKLDRLSSIHFVNLNQPSSQSKSTVIPTTTTTTTETSTNPSQDTNITATTSSTSPVQNGASENVSTPSSPKEPETTTTTTTTPSNSNTTENTTTTTTLENSNTPKLEEESFISFSDIQATLSDSNRYTSLTTLTSTGMLTTSQVLRKEEVVLQVLSGLTYLLDGEEKEKMVRDQFPLYIKSNGGDLSQQLLGFLAVIGENSRVMSLLKVCHQKVILPSYYFIKSNLIEELQFRDKRGSWKMRIIVESDQSIIATHCKRQQSTIGTENDPEFEFEWALSILFDKDMNISNLKVNIVDLIISPNITTERKQIIQRAFSDLQNETQTTNQSPIFPMALNKIDQ
ncbi:hypothetical protein DLAC_00302 [Tieghemostelium lacteum]|uniref:Ras guanine nucleotide exchange factor glfB-like C-terminal domain-containing protein n=1 Tax=Tieghemostelium lacteum TaxID=361077 RepID=A0A152A9E4_TIELA|nr:hypothetical protein DLAC_00302 [Tieghemostelium lacteum]|eukprot:KYR02834.1 hypothetical protein DLAC_00302 [Tieghemostelium lacteum]